MPKSMDEHMQRYFIEFSFDGSKYHGWQIQPNGITVQEVLMRDLSKLLRRPVELTGAGRTDTGVHARQLFAHFDAQLGLAHLTPNELKYKLNRMLPDDISIRSVHRVLPDAHARFSATSRMYKYYFHFQKDPYLHPYSWFLWQPLDLRKMQAAADILKEYIDFASFCRSHANSKTTLCKIHEVSLVAEGHRWIFTIRADRFLRNMVRAIVGTLVEVGKGRTSLKEFRAIIEAKDRTSAGFSAPAHGLFLEEVTYPQHVFLPPLIEEQHD